jgi:hypothetical protein
VGEAAQQLKRALAMASEYGRRPLIARCHLGLGELYRRAGQGERARDHLATATTMFCEMGMRFWLEQAEVAMKEPG